MTEKTVGARNRMMGRRTVLHFTNSTLWGGVEEHICGLLGNLSRNHFHSHLVCAPITFERFRMSCPQDVEITPLPLLSPTSLGAALQFAGLLRRQSFHIVHSHMFWSSLCASPIAWACSVPVIVETLHGSEAWRTGWKANWRVDRAVSRFVTKHVAVSASDAHFLSTRKRISLNKIETIRNGVDVGRFRAAAGARRAIRDALGFAEDDVVLIMVGRFHPGKGHLVLLAAIRQLIDKYPNLKLICLGEGDGEAEVRRLVNDLGLDRSIRLAGYQRDVAAWFMAADVNVLPSYYEGMPLTILEAMAAGLPTVASDVGGIPEAIDDGISGLLVRPGSPERLSSALSCLLGCAELREQMGKAAYARALRCFNIERQIRDTERMYLRLCGDLPFKGTDESYTSVFTARAES